MFTARFAEGGTGRIFGLLGAVAVLGGVVGCSHGQSSADAAQRSTPVGSERAVVAAGAARYQDQSCDAPALVAHRGETGDGRNLPENTWQAELDAATEGVTYMNMDVRWTRDGVPVALHDATVGRTTSESRPNTPITSLTAAQYTALESRYYAGDTAQGRIDPHVHPDTLAEVLARISGTDRPIVLQMEADPLQSAQPGDGAVRDFTALADIIDSSGYADRVIVAGWTLRDLAALHAVAPRLTLAYLFETIGAKQYPTSVQMAAAGAHIVYADYRGITARQTATWHAGGMKVWAWTPATRAAWEALTTDGVDAIATNWSTSYFAWEAHPCSAASAV